MKKRNTYSGMALRVLAVIFAGFLTVQQMAGQGWYNPNWTYRAPITVANTLGSLTDYQVKVTLGIAGPWSSAYDDGSDILFTSSDGTTKIPYWIESWVYGVSAVIWVKVPSIAASPAQTTIFLYYGAQSVSSSEEVAMPPIGPFTKDAGNPGVINGTGAPAADADLLPENIVYDPVTQHYWMVLSDQTVGSRVALVYSDDPGNPDAWYWSGYVINSAIAPHLMEHNGTWYIFYGDRSVASPYPISVATASSVNGTYTKVSEVLPAGVAGTWEDARADEPFVFQHNDGKWILIYMGDAGLNVEQVGYATADDILGPYTKYAGNPCIPFGPAGSIDAGTVADPWVYEFDGVYYIGYTVSPTTSAPWQTALATTANWTTFTKQGLLLPAGSEFNSFRGAVSRIGDEYVFSYAGGPAAGDYRLCIATQPVYAVNGVSNGAETFDFFDGFDGTSFDYRKWTRPKGENAQLSVGGGLLTLTGYPGTNAYIKINGTTSFGIGYVGETRGRHPNQGTNNLIAETGFASIANFDNYLRIVDDFPNTTNWQRQTGSSVTGGDGSLTPMLQTSDKDFHIFHVYRENATLARFQIDDFALETDYTNIPSAAIPPFLMSYSNVTGTNNIFNVDWTRVRKYVGPDPLTTVGAVQFNGNQWTGAVSIYWSDSQNWTSGVPDAGTDVIIPSEPVNQPVINIAAYCHNIIINAGAHLQIDVANTLTVSGDWTNNGTFNPALTATVPTVVFNGEAQTITGTGSNIYPQITFSSTVSTTLTANAQVYGDLSILTGILDLGSNTINNTTTGGVLKVSSGATLKTGATNTLPSGYDTHELGSSSTIEYYGTNQDVAETTYGNLMLSGSGVKTFAANRTISGNLTIKGTARASLATGTNSTANTLILGTEGQAGGTWGSTTAIPAPAHPNDIYFLSTGILTVGTSFTAGNWIGGTSADWNTGANWYGGAVPGSGTDAIIPQYAVFNPVISAMPSPAICNTLTLNAGSTLTINAGQALTVSGNLNNAGSIIIESAWVNSSGSLIAGSVSGAGTVTYYRFLREDNDLGDKHLFSSPVGNQSVADFLTTFDAKIDQIRTWDELAGTWTSLTSGNFISGRGYNLVQAPNSDGHFAFTGSLVNDPYSPVVGTSPYSLSYEARVIAYPTDPYGVTDHNLPIWALPRSWDNYGAGGWNLLGNPFTSAMDAGAFITVNTTTTNRFDPAYQALYLYDGKNGYYKYAANQIPGYYDGGSFGGYIQTGQGFFVLANNNGVQFDFSSSMRVHNTVLPLLKSADTEEPWPGMQLKVKYGSKESLTTIVYGSGMSAGLDPGYDVGQFSTGPGVEIYTSLAAKDNGVNFARQALPVTGADKIIIPVGIDSEKGGEVTFSAMTVPLGTYKFWLEDRITGIFTDISTKSCTVTLPAKTYGTGRFFIYASTNTPTGIVDPLSVETGVRIWTSGGNVVIKGDVSDRSICEVYDLRGQKILETRLSDGELNIITLPEGSKGVYLVRVVDGVKVTTGKIAVL